MTCAFVDICHPITDDYQVKIMAMFIIILVYQGVFEVIQIFLHYVVIILQDWVYLLAVLSYLFKILISFYTTNINQLSYFPILHIPQIQNTSHLHTQASNLCQQIPNPQNYSPNLNAPYKYKFYALQVNIKYQNIVNFMAEKIKPVQLISFDSARNLRVNPEAASLLMSLNNKCRNIAVITVVGKYRTGKSYILNRVLLQQNSGFEVGPTINACTKGLWIWPVPVEISGGEEPLYGIVMDTEGLGSLEEGENTDTKIFLMAMLLSSYFIYNSVGNIDQKAIQSLSLIINLSKLLQKGNSKDIEDIVSCFPSFLWLVRDFALRLQDLQGRKIQPKEYLQNALKFQSGSSQMVVRKNSIRKQLTNFFKQRDCSMLIRPTKQEKDLQKLSELKDSDLRPQFLTLVSELKTKMFGQIKRKTFKGKPCSPSMFIEMCQYFCDAINRGDLPQIQSNWDLVCKAEASRITRQCQTQFTDVLQKYESMDPKQVNLDEFQKIVEKKISDLLKYFQKNSMGDKQKFKKDLKQKFRGRFQQVKQNLERQKNREVESDFYQLSESLENQIGNNYIKNIFQICQQYDKMIEHHSKKANRETLSIVHHKCYEGFKTMAINFFSNLSQTQKFQSNILNQKLNMYQSSYTNLQNQVSRRAQESENKSRQLQNRVYMLELKARETQEELVRAKGQLEDHNKRETRKENLSQNKISV